MKVDVDGIKLFYHSEGSGPALAFLHALGLDHTIWDQQFRRFRDRFTVVGIDLRGHGQSDKPPGPYTVEGMARDVAMLLRREKLAPAVLVGLSLGGMIAMALASHYQDLVKGLVVVAATSEYDAAARQAFMERAMIAETQGMQAIAEGALQRWFSSTFLETARPTAQRVLDILQKNDPTAYAAACRAVASLQITDALRQISSPTLLVAGEHDPALPPPAVERLRSHIRGARFEVVPGASHMIPIERPDYLNRLLEAFLEDLG